MVIPEQKTCVIQLEELLRTSKSMIKHRVDKREYQFQLSRYQDMFKDPKSNEFFRKIALKIMDDYMRNKNSAAKFKIKGNVFDVVRNLKFAEEEKA